MTDPGLRFWLRHVEASGGVSERDGDSVLVMLPPELSRRHGLPEDMLVTDDPDVARSDGAMFLGTGHPALIEAAELRLDQGDAGVVMLDRPATSAPTPEVLQDHARAQLPVSHGRIDLAGTPEFAVHWIARVGVMVSYALSAQDHFTERIERWTHVTGRHEVLAGVVTRLVHAAVAEFSAGHATGDRGGSGGSASADSAESTGDIERVPFADLIRAVASADASIEREVVRRRAELFRQLGGAQEEERTRAESYYADAIAGIERRMRTATPDRLALLAARLASTREEQARRLAEIVEKYQPRHEIRPFRLHAVGVPALRLPFEVRRGERRYPIVLDWLLPAGVFAQPVCPMCLTATALVAGKHALGCFRCLAPKTVPAPAPAPRFASAPRPAAVPDRPGASPAPPATARPTEARPVPAQARAGKPDTKTAKERRNEIIKRSVPSFKQVDETIKTLWNAAAARRSLRLKSILAAASPAEALHTAYGAHCVVVALGIPPSEDLIQFNGDHHRVVDDAGFTRGVVETRRQEYPFVLRWREEHHVVAVTEILTAPVYPDGRLHAYYWWQEYDNPLRIIEFPAPRRSLDEVARSLLTEGGPWHGLSVSARALAAWWRLGDVQAQLLADFEPAVLAAGVHRLAALRAGDKGLFRMAAEVYRVQETRLRGADAKLRKLLDFSD